MCDLIILGKDPDNYDERDTCSRWLLQCPDCDMVTSVTYYAMRQARKRELSCCKGCSRIRHGSGRLDFDNIPGRLIVLEQVVNPGAKMPRALVQCPDCSRIFEKQRGNLKPDMHTFCNACATTRRHFKFIKDIPGQLIVLEQIVGRHRNGDLLARVQCPYCNTVRDVTRESIKTANSTRCHSCVLAGERSPLWRGGRFLGYPDDWRSVAANIQARDGYRCQYPGCETDTSLVVHHIVPLSNEGDNSASNLITLCRPCHAWAHWHLDESIPMFDVIIDAVYNGW